MKSDKWIADRCVGDFPMIEPFAGYLTSKERGEGVISHGLSGYGYDIRCGFEFKIFTNVNAVEVDPKNIDERAFVTVTVKEGEFIRIPPNSFALTHSLEYLRIPRDVVCLSTPKSTYARCFTGSTRVYTLDGENPSFSEMIANPRRRWGIGYTEDAGMLVTELVAPRLIERQAELVRVTLDSGEMIDCTPDHEFLLRQGGVCCARDLVRGSSLMPLYTPESTTGYTQVRPQKRGCFRPVHCLADSWNLRHGVYSAGYREHRHHIDHNKQNNNPTNITRMPAVEHNALHKDDFGRSAACGVGVRKRIARWRQDPVRWAKYCETQRNNCLMKTKEQQQEAGQRLARLARTPEGMAAQKIGINAYYATPEGDANRAHLSHLAQERWKALTEAEKAVLTEKRMSGRKDRCVVTGEQVYAALCAHGSQSAACSALGISSPTLQRFRPVIERWITERRAARAVARAEEKRLNHKVVSVEALAHREDVYCLTAVDSGNFALACGVVVKNCGLVVPTTVLEPQWFGHLTLEISNTTPLPARVYAGEGISQLLFSGADIEMTNELGETMTAMRGGSAEGVVNLRRVECETSYADRKGKYQGQRGITLPKV